MISDLHKMQSKYVSSSLQWNDNQATANRRRDSGRISKGSSRMSSRAATAAANPNDDVESHYSLPPMTARSLYIEPQFRRIDLPEMIRVNVLQPPTVPKRTVTMQTAKATDHNKKRSLKMQREQHQLTHGAWKTYFYGDANKQEKYRASLRAALKDQMSDLSRKNKDERIAEVNYTMEVLGIDEDFRVKDLQNRIDRLTNGINVTKKNQELMHLLEERNKLEAKEVRALEAALLKVFPINPRRTLK